MPTYEYRCKACGEQLEVVQSFTDDALTDCPSCGAAGQLRKRFGSIGITFKGSGFYKTDSRAGSSSSGSSGTAGGDGSSSDASSAPTTTTTGTTPTPDSGSSSSGASGGTSPSSSSTSAA